MSTAGELHRQVKQGDLDDLIADGWVGAVKAARGFEPDRGWAFHTYARHRIRGEIIDGLRRMDYLSRNERNRVTGEISAAQAAGEMYADKRTSLPLSIDLPVDGEDGSISTLGEVLVDQGEAFEETLADRELLGQLMADMWGRHREIIVQHYWRYVSLTDLAERWDLTPSRISQLHAEAIHLLQLQAMRLGVTPHRMVEQLRRHTKRSHRHRFAPEERNVLFGDPLAHWTD